MLMPLALPSFTLQMSRVCSCFGFSLTATTKMPSPGALSSPVLFMARRTR